MEQLEDFISGQEDTTTLDEIIIPEVSPSKKMPESAITNRAATLAAISGSEDGGVEVFKLIMDENELGLSNTAEAVRKMAAERTRSLDYERGVLPVLSDENIDFDTKRKVIESFGQAADQDSTVTLVQDSLIADSPGETVDASEARDTLSDNLIANYRESYIQEQAVINTFRKELAEQSTFTGQALDIAQMVLVPVGEGLSAYSFTRTLNEKLDQHMGLGSKLKAVFRPGATFEEARAKYENLNAEERLAFLKTVVETIKESKGVLFSTDSQYHALIMLERIVGDYSPGEATFDTVVNALDVFVLWQLAKAGVKAARAGKAGAPVADVPPTPEMPEFPVKQDLKVVTAHPDKEKLPILYDKRAELIADSSKVLPKGSVSKLESELVQIDESLRGIDSAFKQETKRLQVTERLSRKQAESKARKGFEEQRLDLEGRKKRVENLLEKNREGQKSEGKIRALDEEIERIENLPDKDGIVRVNPIVDAINRADRNAIIGVENPVSVGAIMMRTNPDRARKLVFAAYAEEGDAAARALFGLPRQEAVASVFMPKQLTATGVVPARPVDVMGAVNKGVNSYLDEVKASVEAKGSVALTAGEQERAANAIINDFKNPTGLKVFDGMDGFHANMQDGKITISSVYGSPGGPFSSAEDAINSAKISLREYGDIAERAELLKKDGINYVPTTLAAEKGKKGDYLVRLSYSRQVDYKDLDVKKLGPLDQFKVKWNMLDAVPAFAGDKQGSLTRHFLHAAALMDKHLTTAASVADVLTNRLEKVLQKKVRDIAKDLNKLSKKEQEALSAYWVEANEKGIPLSLTDFANRGFTNEQYAVAVKWREYWDSIYYLQNKDMKHSLRNQGFMVLDNGQDRLFAKPIPKNINNAVDVYDPETGKLVNLSRAEMDELYENGGTLATTKTKLKVDGKETNNLLVKNDPDNFLRALDESDSVLNYREGYFTTSYKAPIFIDRIDPKTGEKFAVATARDKAEAEAFVKRSQKENPDAEFLIRPEKKRLKDRKEDVWSLEEQGGTSAQKRRGRPLVDSEGSNRLEGAAHFDKPFESAVRASRSIAGRTMFRDIIETAKERAMQKHGHLFPKENGVPKFPSRVSDISSPEGPYTKAVRDARTDFEYINFLENGYRNGLDSAFQTLMGVFAEKLGDLSLRATGVTSKALSAAERGAYVLEGTGPTSLGKFAVFQSFISTSMFRQWFVQPAQAWRMAAYNPTGVPRALGYVGEYASSLAGNTNLSANGRAFIKFMDESGFLDSVDKSNLVRGALTTAGEQSSLYERTLGKITNPLRTIGYDLGEKTNLLSTAASVFERYVREGKNIKSKAVQQEMIGKIDALSYSMRATGDMPYNQNFLALPTQFLQVVHKAALQPFDRRLTRMERSRLVLGDLALYGGPTGLVTAAANALFGEEYLDENPFIKDTIIDGAMSSIVNYSLNNIMDYFDLPKGELDISGSLSPYDYGGYKKMAMTLMTDGGFLSAMKDTPIGNLGNKMSKAIDSVGRFIGFVPDSDIHPTDVGEVLNDIASIASGWSNMQKAILAYELNRVMTKEGQVLINGLSPIQIIGQAFGFQPKEVSQYYETAIELSENKKQYEEDVRNAARTAIQVAVGKTHIGVEDQRTRDIVVSLLMHTYRDKPEAWRFINDEMGRAAQDPTVGLLNSALKVMGLPEYDTDREVLKRAMGPEEFRKYEQLQADLEAVMNKKVEE